MNMKMLRLFSNDEEINNEFLEELEIKNEKQKDPIMDIQLVEYIIKEFPEIAGDIKESLASLKNTLERSIDFIEDKSCEIIKESRDFKLSGKYREASIELYDIGSDITAYVDWMENNIKDYHLKEYVVNETKQVNNADNSVTEKLQSSVDNEESATDITEKNFIAIYEDFTATQPCLFNLDKFRVEVENWDDMVVKTAEVLNKHYKNNKNTYVKVPNTIVPVKKKSKQNDFRDTIIEMLQEYNISLNRYKVLLC